jgi:hypothetical protein
MVMRRSGQSKPELPKAARIRSRAWRIAVSPRPTTVMDGSPLPMSTSTPTGWATRPTSAVVKTRASIQNAASRWSTIGEPPEGQVTVTTSKRTLQGGCCSDAR